jgi:membrane-associated phospholipid phosphatase
MSYPQKSSPPIPNQPIPQIPKTLEYDIALFSWVQAHTACDFLDALLPFWRDKLFWMPLYLFGVAYFLLNHKRKGFLVLLFLGATVGISDFTSASVVKPMMQRPRPCKYDATAFPHRLLVACGNGYSFPSSHAANHFAIAVFLSGILYRKRKTLKIVLFLWAFSIAFAQCYVGVHFPLDLFCGALLGSVCGFIMLQWYRSLAGMTIRI